MWVVLTVRSDTGYRYAGVDEHEQLQYICPAFKGRYGLARKTTLTPYRHRAPLRTHIPRPAPHLDGIVPFLSAESHRFIAAPLFPDIGTAFKRLGCDSNRQSVGREACRGDPPQYFLTGRRVTGMRGEFHALRCISR